MNARILLVEDNDNNRYLAEFLLRRERFVVQTATNGIEALRCAIEHPPDVVVMDIQMPEMDGYETAMEFKKNEQLAHIPLVGVSSFAMPGDRQKAMEAGFAGYIEKPIDATTFVEQVRAYLPVEMPA